MPTENPSFAGYDLWPLLDDVKNRIENSSSAFGIFMVMEQLAKISNLGFLTFDSCEFVKKAQNPNSSSSVLEICSKGTEVKNVIVMFDL